MLSALRAGLGIGILFPEAIPPDCEVLHAKFGLPAAPAAEFGVYVAHDASAVVDELASFLRDGF
jgi:DNA-binding transcriptional LysR family regulator